VIDIATENNTERLRWVAQLLEKENNHLHRRVKDLFAEIGELKGVGNQEQLELELCRLQEMVARQQDALFGKSSERRGSLETSKEPEEKEVRKTGHGRTEQKQLQLVEVVHLLDDADKACPKCGLGIEEWLGQFEASEEIDVIERQFIVKKHLRQKYKCECGECIETALGPEKLIPGGRYSIDFAIDVAVSKYLDHLPLERQRRIMLREDLKVSAQTLWDQIEALARLLESLPKRIQEYILSHDFIGADETRWRLLNNRSNKSWYVWGISADDSVYYSFANTRGADAAKVLLADYDGVVMSDGYAVYQSLQKSGADFELAHCWAHVRRKFVEAEKAYPLKAGAVLGLIGELFRVEKEYCTGPPEETLEARKKYSEPIIEALKVWTMDCSELPRSSFGSALTYMRNLFDGLTLFLENPVIGLDNNACERAMRGIVLGRKNHLGSKSKRGTEVAALFYSLVESAKLCDIEPRKYLRAAVSAALGGREIPLPHEFRN
tara:strand:+ start:830 stop:2311 length:1482 start_codon:yes stop_codon:yes gene_type:complete